MDINNLTEQDLARILEEATLEVDAAIAEIRKSQPDTLRKSDPEEEESTPVESPEASAVPADPATPEATPEPAADPGEGEGSPDGMAPEQLEEELTKAYAQMDPEALMIHFNACRAAVQMAMQGAGPGPQEGSPPTGPGSSAPGAGTPEGSAGPGIGAGPGPGPDDLALGKSDKALCGDGKHNGTVGKMAKSEDLDALLKKFEEQNVAIETLTKAIELVVTKPTRKAVTGDEFLGKSEAPKPLSRAEVNAKLARKAADVKLAKSDRDLINGYVVGSITVDKIEHLLK